tara:strand:+ start:372 stop:878 length:507 start_codon:yes stop_codon:yes gene_type:complete
MQKKSKVTNVQANGTWEGSYGTMYKFEVTFENGDTGEYSSKSLDQNKFVIGHETEYEFTDGKYPKVKPVYNAPSGGSFNKYNNDPDRQRMIVKQSSLKVASDLCIANNKTDLNSVFKVADQIVKWVMDNKSDMSSNQEVTTLRKEVIKEMESFAEQSGQSVNNHDLPF